MTSPVSTSHARTVVSCAPKINFQPSDKEDRKDGSGMPAQALTDCFASFSVPQAHYGVIITREYMAIVRRLSYHICLFLRPHECTVES
jgi:hypothetical protein